MCGLVTVLWRVCVCFLGGCVGVLCALCGVVVRVVVGILGLFWAV